MPVISYDRLINDADIDYYISFDNEKVGELQGHGAGRQAEEDGKADGTIVMINGSPTDNNATLFKKGAHSVIDESDLTVGAEYDTPDWSPDKAQTRDGPGHHPARQGRLRGRLRRQRRHRRRRHRRHEGRRHRPAPPVTGQDAELAGIQRILAGEQYMTVYKAIKPEAEAAASLAVALRPGRGRHRRRPTPVNNGAKDVPPSCSSRSR